jgi:ATP-binding cassette subfamily F protein 3
MEKEMATSALEIQNADGEARKQAERKYSSLVDQYESRGGYNYHNSMDRVVDGVGLSQEVLRTPIKDASGGERTRAALATALLGEPDILVLDEPTNYLDFRGLEWLEDFLSKFQNAFIAVSHDRYFLDKVATEIWEIDLCRMKSYRGNFSKYRTLKQAEDERAAKEYQRQQDHIKREEYFIARYHAGQRSKEARGRAKKLSRIERIEAPSSVDSVNIASMGASRTGQTVISTRNLEVGYYAGNEAVKLFEVPDSEIEKETTTAIIGSNGIGKTTLLRTILGEIPPLNGTSYLGHNVEVGYFRQGSDDIPGDLTVMEALLQIRNIAIGEARSFLARFLFKGEEIFEQVKSLSGGERGRLELARLLITKPNVLVLDEPTTHLDIPSREALEDMMQEFAGTIIFVSHDRHLISLLADRIWMVDKGHITQFEGTYLDWLGSLERTLPKRVRNRSQKARVTTTKAKPTRTISENTENQKKPTADYEGLIRNLEERIAEIEKRIENASTYGDVGLISKLGIEHAQVSSELEKTINSWIE